MLQIFLVLGSALALSILAASSPSTWLARLLFSSYGPRLDADRMTRGECVRAALGFFLKAGLGLGTALVVAWAGDRMLLDREWVRELMMLVFASVGMVGLGGGLYMLTKATFRPAVVISRPALAYLKEYVDASAGRRLSLWERSDGAVAVLAQERAVAPAGNPSTDGWGPARILAEGLSITQAERLALEEAGYTKRP